MTSAKSILSIVLKCVCNFYALTNRCTYCSGKECGMKLELDADKIWGFYPEFLAVAGHSSVKVENGLELAMTVLL